MRSDARATLALFFFLGLSGRCDVYNGGTYSDEKMSVPIGDMGGRTGEALPYATAYIDDREQNVSLDRAIYVFGEDNACFRAKFSEFGHGKALVVFSQPTYSAAHCIYQKKFHDELAGFSIFTRDGGICMPTYSDASLEDFNADPKNKLEVVHNRVSFRYCVENTVSYGEILKKGKSSQVAKTTVKPVKHASHTGKDKKIVQNKKVAAEVKVADEIKIAAEEAQSGREKVTVSPIGDLQGSDQIQRGATRKAGPKQVRDSRKLASKETEKEDVLNHKYTIQLASYSNHEEAQKRILVFQSKGIGAFELTQSSEGQIRYRVCVGTFDNMPSAQRSLREINEKSIAQAFVQMIHPRDEGPSPK